MSAIDVLKRARLRIAAHGYDPGVTEPRKGKQPRKGFLGYSLSEAVYGLDRTSDATEEEIAALGFLEAAIATLHPRTPTVGTFNLSHPSKAAVQNVIERAINLARVAPSKPEPLPQLGPKLDLEASDGLEGIVQAGQRPPLSLVGSREAEHARVSALAGVDPSGGIIPETGGGIDREKTPFWKSPSPAPRGNAS